MCRVLILEGVEQKSPILEYCSPLESSSCPRHIVASKINCMTIYIFWDDFSSAFTCKDDDAWISHTVLKYRVQSHKCRVQSLKCRVQTLNCHLQSLLVTVNKNECVWNRFSFLINGQTVAVKRFKLTVRPKYSLNLS